MIHEIRNAETRSYVGTIFECHGCSAMSARRKKPTLPPRWKQASESIYTARGKRVYNTTRQVNYYCPACAQAGCTAATVARGAVKAYRTRSEASEEDVIAASPF